MGAAVVHFEVIGKDAKLLTEFYEGMFGWKIDTDNPVGYGLVPREGNLNSDGIGIGGGIAGAMPGNDSYAGHVTFYVEVPDVEAALQEAERRGGTRIHGPDQVPGGPVLGQFLDPEGHLVGLTQAGS